MDNPASCIFVYWFLVPNIVLLSLLLTHFPWFQTLLDTSKASFIIAPMMSPSLWNSVHIAQAFTTLQGLEPAFSPSLSTPLSGNSLSETVGTPPSKISCALCFAHLIHPRILPFLLTHSYFSRFLLVSHIPPSWMMTSEIDLFPQK